MADVRTNLSFVIDIANLRFTNSALDKIIFELAKIWTQAAATLIPLIAANQKIRGVAQGSIKQDLKDSGLAAVKNIKACRRRLLQFTKKLDQKSEQRQAELLKLKDVKDISPEQEAQTTWLLEIGVPPSCLTEMSSESFDDVVARQAAIHMTSLKDTAMDFEEKVAAFSRPRAWAISLILSRRAKLGQAFLQIHRPMKSTQLHQRPSTACRHVWWRSFPQKSSRQVVVLVLVVMVYVGGYGQMFPFLLSCEISVLNPLLH